MFSFCGTFTNVRSGLKGTDLYSFGNFFLWIRCWRLLKWRQVWVQNLEIRPKDFDPDFGSDLEMINLLLYGLKLEIWWHFLRFYCNAPFWWQKVSVRKFALNFVDSKGLQWSLRLFEIFQWHVMHPFWLLPSRLHSESHLRLEINFGRFLLATVFFS